MYAFSYKKAGSVADASALLKQDDEAKLLAGGQTLLPTLKQRLARPTRLIDLAGIAGLAGIKRDGDKLEIGAMTRHAAVANSADVKAVIPALAALAEGIGDPQVRNRGTIGGSIANNDPAADYPAGCLALGAVIHTDKRQITSDDFFTGMFSTALEDGEVITAVAFTKPAKAAYVKFPNPASRYAIVGVFVAVTAGGVRVAVTGAGQSGVFRLTDAEKALAASFTPAALDGVTVDEDMLNADIHAGADYRAHLIKVMAKRAVTACG
jgi:carbon-monoxide dehydrogenase medium subunit